MKRIKTKREKKEKQLCEKNAREAEIAKWIHEQCKDKKEPTWESYKQNIPNCTEEDKQYFGLLKQIRDRIIQNGLEKYELQGFEELLIHGNREYFELIDELLKMKVTIVNHLRNPLMRKGKANVFFKDLFAKVTGEAWTDFPAPATDLTPPERRKIVNRRLEKIDQKLLNGKKDVNWSSLYEEYLKWWQTEGVKIEGPKPEFKLTGYRRQRALYKRNNMNATMICRPQNKRYNRVF